MPLARKFLLSDLLSNLLSLRISSASIKFSSILNLSVLQPLSPSSGLLLSLLSSCVFPSAVRYTSISTLLYARYSISSSVFTGQGSFVSSPVSTDWCFLCRLGLPWKYPFHLPVCVGGNACITGTPFTYLPT